MFQFSIAASQTTPELNGLKWQPTGHDSGVRNLGEGGGLAGAGGSPMSPHPRPHLGPWPWLLTGASCSLPCGFSLSSCLSSFSGLAGALSHDSWLPQGKNHTLAEANFRDAQIQGEGH